jgi:hypothetical protein
VTSTQPDTRLSAWAAAALLLLLLVVTHYDVIVLGRSLVTTNYSNPLDYRPLPENYGPHLVPHDEWTRRNLWPYANVRDPGATWWQWEPSTRFLEQAIALGEWPFWDPYIGGGTPAMANLVPAFFFPPFTLVVLLGASVALLNAYFLFLMWGASLLTFLFVRRHGVGFVPSLAAATIVLLSGSVQQHAGTFIGQTAACLPLVMYATRALLDRPDRTRAAWMAAAYATTALASFPPLLIAMFGIVAVYALAGFAERPRTERLRVAGVWAAGVLLSLGVVAFCYLPAFALRAATPEIASMYHGVGLEIMPASSLYQVLSPTLMGGIQTYLDPPIDAPGPYIPYVGLVALALSLCAAHLGNPKARTLLVAAALATAFIVLKLIGSPIVQWVGSLPLLGEIHIARYFGIPLGFLLASMAALGAHALSTGMMPPARALGAAIAAILLGESLWRVAAARGVFVSTAAEYWLRDWRVLAIVTVSTAVALLYAALARDRLVVRRTAVAALLALAAAEGVYNGWFPKPAAWNIFEHPVPYVRALQQTDHGSRVFPVGALPANVNSAFGIASVASQMAFNPPRMYRWFRRYTQPPRTVFMILPSALPPDPVLDGANIGFIGVHRIFTQFSEEASKRGYKVAFDDGFTILYERPTLPRFFFTSDYRVVDPSLALDAIATVAGREVVLETAPDVPPSPNAETDPAVTVESARRNSTTLVVDAPRPGLLYASESYFDGWSARIDGRPVEILPANYAFRAIAVPPGRSRIEFRYWPPGLTLGLVVSGGALLGLIAFGFGSALSAPASARRTTSAAP